MNNETKELLELAARAMGFEINTTDDTGVLIFRGDGDEWCWNPLEYATDCEEMECQLMIDACHTDDDVECGAFDSDVVYLQVIELIKDHPSRIAAKRLAVLRVAAEIGRMKE